MTGLHGAGVSTVMSSSMAAGAVSIGNGQDLTVERDRSPHKYYRSLLEEEVLLSTRLMAARLLHPVSEC